MNFKLDEKDDLTVFSDTVAAMVREADAGAKYHEIAAKHDLPLGTVRSRLNRARNRLLDARAAREIEESAVLG